LTQRFLAETILGLAGLHSKNFVYRDLKLENILVDSEGHIRLSDFGLSAKLKKGKKIHTYSGTAVYLAPEILLDEGEGHDHSIDVWALGVMAHLMLTQQVCV
jgi:serine/threonine protein kinase